ncbi:unnamed protein product [marine sediment metagenome]|uniref:Uncharacterized protein n=1 Tax=marine sediment metagenome TaxID=412755 RepID=X0YX19_9ZZZZ
MAIGDTTGIDAPFPMGWAAVHDGGLDMDGAESNWVNKNFVAGTAGNVAEFYTATTVGPLVPGYGGGGVHLDNTEEIQLSFGNLPPGNYALSFAHTNTANALIYGEKWVFATMRMQEWTTAFAAAGQKSWTDTLVVVEGDDVQTSITSHTSLSTGNLSTPTFYYHLPRDLGNFWNPSPSSDSAENHGFNTGEGRNWMGDPVYSIMLGFSPSTGVENISDVHLYYLGE